MMKLAAFLSLLLLFCTAANALSELMPSENFEFKLENNLWTNCQNVKNAYQFREASTLNEEANEKIQSAKQNLLYAYLLAQLQQSPIGKANPLLYSASGFECSVMAVNAMRDAVQATGIITTKIDLEVQKLDFEIGDGFTGPGSNELMEAKEAVHGVGELGQLVEQITTSTSSVVRSSGDAGKASTVGAWFIEENGAIKQLDIYLQKVKRSNADVKSLEESLESQARQGIGEAAEKLQELKQQEVNKLGWFEISQLKLEKSQGVEIGETLATSPSGLMRESETLLEKAKNILNTGKFKTRGGTGRRINDLTNALSSIQLANSASKESMDKTLAIMNELERTAFAEEEKSREIQKPFAKQLVEKTMGQAKLDGSYFGRITGLNGLVKDLKNIQQAYSGETNEEDKLKLKIETRELQRIANEAAKHDLQGANEVGQSLKNLYSLIDEAATVAELNDIESEKNTDQKLLFNLIEEKFNYLRSNYEEAEQLAKSGALTSEEERELGQLRDVFSGQELPAHIGEIGDIEKTLKKVVENQNRKNNENPASAVSLANNFTVREIQFNSNTSTALASKPQLIDLEGVSNRLQELAEQGAKAFYTNDKTKKSLEQLSFEDALKKAQQKATELRKSPTSEKLKEVNEYIDKMDKAVQEVQKKSGLEIAIAEQRGAAIDQAQKQWEDGRYAEALLEARKQNKQTSSTAAPLTANVINSKNDDPKLMAIAISIVVILIGAAYLLYVKKNEQQPV